MEEEEKTSKPYPQELPKPTWAPLMVSMGIMMLFWAVLTHWAMAVVGLLVFFYGLIIWIKDLIKENGKEE